MDIMNRLLLLLILSFLGGCGGNSITKPSVIENADNYSQEAIQAYSDEQWALAKHLFNRALNLYQGVDDQAVVLATHINLVEVALSAHNAQDAKHHLNGLDSSGKDQRQPVLLLKALFALQQKQMTEAAVFLQPLLPKFDGDDNALVSVDEIQLTAIATQTKLAFTQKQDESLWVSRYARTLQKVNNQDEVRRALLYRFQARLLVSQEEYAPAANKLQQALLIYKSHQVRRSIAMTLFELGELYEMQNDNEEALAYFNRSTAVFKYLKDEGMLQ